jgi:hypothetical protein
VPYSYGQTASTYNGITTGPDVRLAQCAGADRGEDLGAAAARSSPAPPARAPPATIRPEPGTPSSFASPSGSQLCLACHIK